jgi:acyl-coenzyme A synthetase/AMP-(fatty) acid ligase
MQKEPGLRRGDVLLAVTTPSFDIAGLELFLPLTVGAKTVIASRGDVLDGERLRERIESCGATMLQATPATWRLLIDAGWQGKADLTALCGGEALPRDLAKELSSRVRALFNMYGPTETTVWSTVHRVVDCERDIPIGHPIANTNVYVLDASGRPAPVGVAGELCIGGEGVARGYRQRPELTAEKFAVVKPPGRAPERVYRTGDVVRLRADLALEFVGRRDHQVKLRGYRIELGEIEAVLADQPAVRRSVVIVREDIPGDPRLVAYVVPKDEGVIPMEELRAALRARLPEYMVPSLIVPLASLPLTANDKIDRKALPVPQTARASAATDDTIMTEPQRRVAAIWCSVLKLERVGLYENFFDIGGHSLLVIKVHTLLRREFGVELTVVDLFQRTTVAGQAELVSLSGERDAGLSRARARAARQAESSVEGSQ